VEQAAVTDHFRPKLYDTLVEVSNEEAYTLCRSLNQVAC
jgi:cysteine synthase